MMGNEQAFPMHERDDALKGMTLRQYYAGMAMQGLLANPSGPIQQRPDTGWGYTNCKMSDTAQLCKEIASMATQSLDSEYKADILLQVEKRARAEIERVEGKA